MAETLASYRMPESPKLQESDVRNHYFRYLGHEIRFDPVHPPEEKLRLITRSDWLSPYHRILFHNLFPDDLTPKAFDIQAITPTESTELRPQEKEVRRVLEEQYGFVTPKRKLDRGEKPGPEDVWTLGVAFTHADSAITTLLNNLPGFRRLALIGQTDPRLRSIQDHRTADPRLNISRADHSKDFALMVARTNFTMAMKTPELYIERVQADIKRYGKIYAAHHPEEQYDMNFVISPETRAVVRQAITSLKDIPDSKRDSLITALEHAVEYGKYLLVAAYLHDIKTPAWGDIFMKAKAQRIGQKPISFSEDRTLETSIDQMIHQDRSGLPHVAHRFSLSPVLLSTMIKSMAGEGDPCLPGELMKAKRKYSPDVLALFPHLSALRHHAVYDHDQRSGTKTNAENVVSKYLPGGFIQLRRTSGVEEPIGSFEERARLVMHAIAVGATKKDIENACIQLNLDPKRVYIAAEEIDFGSNLELRAVDIPYKNPETNEVELRREVLPVATRPGDVKKAMLMFNILSMEEYQNPQRAAGEELLQNMITSALWGESRENQSYINEDDFIYGADASLADKLETIAPAIPWVMENLMDKGKIVTEEELREIAARAGKTLPRMLVKECRMDHLPQWKEGTLVVADANGSKEEVKPYLEVIDHKRSDPPGTVNPLSLPARLSDVTMALKSSRLFYVLELDDEARLELLSQIPTNSPTGLSMRRALLTWTEPVIINGQEIKNALFRDFAAEGYEINGPLLKKRATP